MRNVIFLLIVAFVISLSGCATTRQYNESKSLSQHHEEVVKEKGYEPKIEPVMENKYITLTTGTIRTPDYFSRIFVFKPKKGEEILVPAKWNDRIGIYELDQDEFKKAQETYTPEQAVNLLAMCYELAIIYEKLQLKLKLLEELEKGDPV